VIAVGEQTATARRDVLGQTEVHVLPNAVASSRSLTADERTALRSSFMKDATQPLTLSVGRLTTQKAHDDLISAWGEVHRSSPGAELAIAGRGHLLADLERSIVDLDLGEVVHLLGSRPDVRELMHASDVFVMSSKWEGLPVALLEAMEADLPLVSTAVGDVPAVMRDACGLMVEPGHVAELSDALSKAINRLPCSGAGTNRKIVEDRYSAHAWARAMADHYDAAMAQAVGGRDRSLSRRIRRMLDSIRHAARRR
jgi:glycosyltransferase involved in cell wall biosynthesis